MVVHENIAEVIVAQYAVAYNYNVATSLWQEYVEGLDERKSV